MKSDQPHINVTQQKLQITKQYDNAKTRTNIVQINNRNG
jgi:hypothetical protein